MPFFQTASATAAGGMLGDERRENAVAHRCLLAVVGDKCWSQPLGNRLPCALFNLFPTFRLDISLILGVQIERAAELRLGQTVKERLEVNLVNLLPLFTFRVVLGKQ